MPPPDEPPRAWPWLPNELYVHILSFLPTVHDAPDIGARTLAACLAANTHLRAAARTPALWERHYRTRYTECVEEREARRLAATQGDWCALYAERRRLDARALGMLDGIRTEVAGRHARARVFAREFGFDVWDALGVEAGLSYPVCFDGASGGERERLTSDEGEARAHALPRRYWARTVRGVIARHYALSLWGRIMDGDEDVTFEQALSGLSAFFDMSPRRISLALDKLAAWCRSLFVSSKIVLDPDAPGYDLPDLIVRVRHVLHSIGYGVVDGADFYHPLVQFPHHFMGDGHHKTIPMSLVFVFVGVARRLGIDASPTNFPGRVLAHVSAPGAPGDMLFDLCSAAPPITFRTREPAAMLAELGLPADAPRETVVPCRAGTTLYRAAANVLLSSSRAGDASAEACVWANYAARCVFLLHAQAVFDFRSFLSAKPLDARAVLGDVLRPALNPVIGETLEEHCAEVVKADEADAARRFAREGKVRYFVGQVVKHTMQEHVGVIVGWHPKAVDVDVWTAIPVVPEPSQPFYIVFTRTGGRKYIAQELLRPCLLETELPKQLFAARTAFARYFEGVEMGEGGCGRFLLSDEVKTLYPEDDAVGAAWVADGKLSDWEDILT